MADRIPRVLFVCGQNAGRSQMAAALFNRHLAAGAARVVTMGCAEGECPVVSAPVEDWGLPDPAGQPLEAVRAIRDDIDQRVLLLVSALTS
jgi:protein-tyrosine-phosphatase